MSPADALAGKHLLVTGATGFVGKVLLERLLLLLPQTRLTLLVRDADGIRGAERVGAMLAAHPAFARVREQAHAVERVRVWEGSLADLDTPPADVLQADLVVHLASRVDFEPSPRAALDDNVHGADAIASLAARTRGRRLVYVSTAYVAGTGSREVPETPCELSTDVHAEVERLQALATAVDDTAGTKLLRKRARELGFANGYTLTKAIAEHRIARAGLHTTIVRPSVVEAAWESPYRGFHDGFRTCAPLTWLSASGLFKVPSRPGTRLDLVPVDQVARGLVLASASAVTEGVDGAIWQLCTSAVSPLSMDRLTELVELSTRRHGGPDGTIARVPAVLGVTPSGDRTRLPGGLAAALRRTSALFGGLPEPLERSARTLEKVQRAADLFAPFIVDTDHAFRCDRALAATAALAPEDRATFGFDPGIDWRRWWVEAQYPGLQKHCFGRRQPLPEATPWRIQPVRSMREAG